jgi:ribosomal-protein-alanine N-acetyltransferase
LRESIHDSANSCGYNGPVKYSLRDFRQEDFETVWRIDQQCFNPGIAYSRLELSEYLRRPQAFGIVAETSAQGNFVAKSSTDARPSMVGFIVAETWARGRGHIITIDVIPEARKSGVGSTMLRAAESRLSSASCQSVILETAVDNVSALAFYKTHGYNIIKTIPRYYSDGVDALVLKKDLLSPSEPAKLPQ